MPPITSAAARLPHSPATAPEMVLLGLTAEHSFGPPTRLPTKKAMVSPTTGMLNIIASSTTCRALGCTSARAMMHMPGSTTVSRGMTLTSTSSSRGASRNTTHTSVARHTAIRMGTITPAPKISVRGMLMAMPTQVGQDTGRCPARARAWYSSYTAKQMHTMADMLITAPPK